jgi:hypothetical protein
MFLDISRAGDPTGSFFVPSPTKSAVAVPSHRKFLGFCVGGVEYFP